MKHDEPRVKSVQTALRDGTNKRRTGDIKSLCYIIQ